MLECSQSREKKNVSMSEINSLRIVPSFSSVHEEKKPELNSISWQDHEEHDDDEQEDSSEHDDDGDEGEQEDNDLEPRSRWNILEEKPTNNTF